MNRTELQKAALRVTGPLLKENGYIGFVDVFKKLGYLSEADYEKWRRKQVPYLEQVIKVNLKKIHLVMKTVKQNCERGKLVPSRTVYKSWGKGPKKALRFSISGKKYVEDLYATHFLSRKKAEPKEPEASAEPPSNSQP